MKRLHKLWLCGLMIAGLGGFAATTTRVSAADIIIHIGADVAPAPSPVVYHYVYYPEEEAYFVPETRVYWWADHGTWRSGPRMPEGVILSTSVNIGVDAQEPWRHHEVIVKQYPHHKHDEKREEKREEKHDH